MIIPIEFSYMLVAVSIATTIPSFNRFRLTTLEVSITAAVDWSSLHKLF